jgi:hypothetical protein
VERPSLLLARTTPAQRPCPRPTSPRLRQPRSFRKNRRLIYPVPEYCRRQKERDPAPPARGGVIKINPPWGRQDISQAWSREGLVGRRRCHGPIASMPPAGISGHPGAWCSTWRFTLAVVPSRDNGLQPCRGPRRGSRRRPRPLRTGRIGLLFGLAKQPLRTCFY